MPAPSTILDRPEFAVLRYMDADDLRRIHVAGCKRSDPLNCPIAMATVHVIASVDDAAAALAHSADEEDALLEITAAFIEAWDGERMSYGELEAAVSAALAEKEGADARP